MIRHIVAWKFADHLTQEERQKHAQNIKEQLEHLKTVIPQLQEIRVIIDPAPTGTHDMILNSLFQSNEDLAIYQEHPAHKEAGKLIGSVTQNRVCLDFEEATLQ